VSEILYSKQKVTFLDRLAVFHSLGDRFLTQGPAVVSFENKVCELTGAVYGVSVNSATSALHIACSALGIGEGDSVWVPSITFVASANCARYVGAKVKFIDIDPKTWNISIEGLSKMLSDARNRNAIPKAIVVVHLAGNPVDMHAIHELSVTYNFFVIEDASHALGSSSRGAQVGSCEFSDITIFSFHAVKNITTGEGGIALTNSEALATRMRLLRSHGVVRDPKQWIGDHDEPPELAYEQQSLGYNFRMTDFQATLGLSQLSRLAKYNSKRGKILDFYKRELEQVKEVRFQGVPSTSESATHLALVRVPSYLRNRLARYLLDSGIRISLHYPPVHLQPYYRAISEGVCPEAEAYGSEALSLPCHPGLSKTQLKRIVRKLREFLVAQH
jgi:UDP-4-amino-4,6-dideoxy-N-acetyl-beta-L-altrosamine transaminase